MSTLLLQRLLAGFFATDCFTGLAAGTTLRKRKYEK